MSQSCRICFTPLALNAKSRFCQLCRETLNLTPRTYPRNRQWLVEDVQAYANTLPPKARTWIARYMKEAVGGWIDKNDPLSILNTDALRRDAWRANHRCNRDAMAILGAAIVFTEDEGFAEQPSRDLSPEDRLLFEEETGSWSWH